MGGIIAADIIMLMLLGVVISVMFSQSPINVCLFLTLGVPVALFLAFYD